jgi:pSer/pThr/pTyr-binding forkhead associated (FHA) protein
MADDNLHGHVNAVEETQVIQKTHEEQTSTEADRHVRHYTWQKCTSIGRHAQVLCLCSVVVDRAHVAYW